MTYKYSFSDDQKIVIVALDDTSFLVFTPSGNYIAPNPHRHAIIADVGEIEATGKENTHELLMKIRMHIYEQKQIEKKSEFEQIGDILLKQALDQLKKMN